MSRLCRCWRWVRRPRGRSSAAPRPPGRSPCSPLPAQPFLSSSSGQRSPKIVRLSRTDALLRAGSEPDLSPGRAVEGGGQPDDLREDRGAGADDAVQRLAPVLIAPDPEPPVTTLLVRERLQGPKFQGSDREAYGMAGASVSSCWSCSASVIRPTRSAARTCVGSAGSQNGSASSPSSNSHAVLG